MYQKSLFLVLLCLRTISSQIRAKLQQTLKGVLNCRKLRTSFKEGFPILSVTETLHPTILYLMMFINFPVDFAMSPIMVRVSDT